MKVNEIHLTNYLMANEMFDLTVSGENTIVSEGITLNIHINYSGEADQALLLLSKKEDGQEFESKILVRIYHPFESDLKDEGLTHGVLIPYQYLLKDRKVKLSGKFEDANEADVISLAQVISYWLQGVRKNRLFQK